MIVHLAAALPVLPALLSEDFEALKRDMHRLTRAETLTRLAGLRAQSLAQGSRPHQDKIDHFVVLLCVSQLGVCERGRESLIHLPIHYIHSRLGATHNLT